MPASETARAASPAANGRRLILASRSPRRRLLLEQMGVAFETAPRGVDDSPLRPGPACSSRQWVAALAYLKAAAISRLALAGGGTVLGADTVCAVDDRLLGQPRDADAAAAMLRLMVDREHQVLTGVALVSSENRTLLTDVAVVRVGRIGPEAIGEYISSGGWRGKAGGYNLSERLQAGWPIEVQGDPATVMGLPVRRLEPLLEEFRRSDAA
jgi:septum formation protein